MDRDTVWRHIHTERADLARTLAGLTSEQWETESLCPGWRVHDVAAHVIANPQIRLRDVVAMAARNLGRGYNQIILREVRRLGATTTREQVLADFDTYADSRRRVPTTTTIEPLVDALVHHQDIVRPLGLTHDMDPEAAAVAADRCRLLAGLMGSRRAVRGTRMVATDHEWSRGSGPVLAGPMSELLMVCAGRYAAARDLEGEGVSLLSAPADR